MHHPNVHLLFRNVEQRTIEGSELPLRWDDALRRFSGAGLSAPYTE
jgi:hypothetical protein